MAIKQTTPLQVTIVGGGLGGLACAIACHREGFDVLILEQAQEFLPIGDSIGLGSNSARLLNRWGVGEELEKVNTHINEAEIYNFDSSDRPLGVDAENSKTVEKYGCRAYIGRRSDFHLILVEHCRKIGIPIRMATSVAQYDNNKPSVTLESGEEILSDVVICADGVKSRGREAVLGYEDRPLHSGYAVYRAIADSKVICDDPLTEKFIHEDKIRIFIAPDLHCIITTLRGGTEINAVLTHRDVADIEEGWNKPGHKDEVLSHMEGWDPSVRRVWEKMDKIIDWKLIYRPCLKKWVADSGLVALMGDAAHPFLPTSVQGASQAIEDGATIAKCLAKVHKQDIPLALHTYFEIRHDYVAAAQATGIEQREVWHNLHDSASKEFKEAFDINKVSQQNYHLWANDAEKVVEDQWEEKSAEVRKHLG